MDRRSRSSGTEASWRESGGAGLGLASSVTLTRDQADKSDDPRSDVHLDLSSAIAGEEDTNALDHVRFPRRGSGTVVAAEHGLVDRLSMISQLKRDAAITGSLTLSNPRSAHLAKVAARMAIDRPGPCRRAPGQARETGWPADHQAAQLQQARA